MDIEETKNWKKKLLNCFKNNLAVSMIKNKRKDFLKGLMIYLKTKNRKKRKEQKNNNQQYSLSRLYCLYRNKSIVGATPTVPKK